MVYIAIEILLLVAHWLERWCDSLAAKVQFLACPVQRQLLQGETQPCYMYYMLNLIFTQCQIDKIRIGNSALRFHKHQFQIQVGFLKISINLTVQPTARARLIEIG